MHGPPRRCSSVGTLALSRECLGVLTAQVPLPALGPKLFKEPSSKSNKPIIHNAVSHCCLAGKVNEPHKNSILEASVGVTVRCL